jgi:hypothetical protein
MGGFFAHCGLNWQKTVHTERGSAVLAELPRSEWRERLIMKLIQALIKLCVSIMITALVCVVCTFTVMNAYIDMVLDQYQLKSAALTAPNWNQFMAHLGKQAEGYRLFGEAKVAGSDTLPPKAVTTIRETPQEDAVAVFGQQKETEMRTEPKNGESRANAGKSAGSGGAIDPGNSSSAGTANTESSNGTTNASSTGGVKIDSSTSSSLLSGAGGKVVVSGEEFTKKKEQLSNDDKNQIFKLLTRVPQAEIQNISLMMEDGITASELAGIEQLLQNYLKPEEYSQLLSMIKPQ